MFSFVLNATLFSQTCCSGGIPLSNSIGLPTANKGSFQFSLNYDFNNTEIILSDNEGNKWNVFGEAISGPRKGAFLKFAKNSMMAYYFSIEAFYPNTVIFIE